MQTQWIFSSTFLPVPGGPIEFMVDDREQPIHGIFADGIFHSRWADYEADRVQSWRDSESQPDAEAIVPDRPVVLGRWRAALHRIASALTRRRVAVAPIGHARTPRHDTDLQPVDCPR